MSNFECKGCGQCCSNFLPLTQEEIKLMKKLAKKENKHLLRQDWYNRCPFLNNNNKCDIYQNRPSICKSYKCGKSSIEVEGEFLEKITKEKFDLVDTRKEIFRK